jgi:choline kinase
MRVICLSAGRSTRMLPLTAELHKSCLTVGGRPIIEWQLSSFERAGLKDIVLVVGHGHQHVRQLCEPWSRRLNLEFVYNDRYDTLNLDYSLYCAEKFLDGPVLYYEGDLLLPPHLIRSLIPQENETVVAVSRRTNSQQIDTMVRRDGDSVYLEFVEHGAIPSEQGEGEFVCAVGLSGNATHTLKEGLKSSTFSGPMRLYQFFNGIFRENRVALVDASMYPWVEIDNQEDLVTAEQTVEGFVA